MADGFFRCKEGFTVVQNVISRDKNVSMKAKGLYLVIQSYITMQDKKWLKSDFEDMVGEGEKAFNNAWNELKEAGYLKTHIYPNSGKFTNEYELLDRPETGPHTYYYNKDGVVTNTNETKKKAVHNPLGDDKDKKIQVEEEERNPQKGIYAKGSNANGNNGKGTNANGGDKNNSSLIKTDYKNISSIPSFIPITGDEEEVERMKELLTPPEVLDDKTRVPGVIVQTGVNIVTKNKGIPIDLAYNPIQMKQVILALCDWNSFIDDDSMPGFNREIYRTVIETLTEMCTTIEPMQLKGSIVTYKNVIDQLNRIYKKRESVRGILSTFMDTIIEKYREASAKTKIKNPKLYLRSMIWEILNIWDIGYSSDFCTAFGGQYS